MSEPEHPDSLQHIPMPPDIRRRRGIFFALWGAGLVGVLFLFRGVLLPFFLALVVAYVLEPVCTSLEGRQFGSKTLPRWGAVVIVYAALLSTITLSAVVGAPRLAAEVRKLASDMPAAVAEARDEYLPRIERELRRSMRSYGAPEEGDAETPAAEETHEAHDEIVITPREDGEGYAVHLPEGGLIVEERPEGYVLRPQRHHEASAGDFTTSVLEAFKGVTEDSEEGAVTVLRAVQAFAKAAVKGIFTFGIMLMLSAYLLITRESVLAFFRSLVWPRRRPSFDRLLQRIDKGLSGVVRGQLLICLVNGVLSGILFYALDLRYWPVLTLVATVLSIIPIFGAIASSVPAVVIGLQASFGTAALVLIGILVIHQIEANFLNPKIMGDAAHVHPVLVVFALLAGESLFGFAGALLAVPILSITQSLFLHTRETALEVATPLTARLTDPPPEG